MKSYYIAPNDNLFIFREEEDGAVIFFRKTGEIKILNETGAFVFKQIYDNKRTINEIVDNMLEVLEGDKPNFEVLKQDIQEFIDEISTYIKVDIS